MPLSRRTSRHMPLVAMTLVVAFALPSLAHASGPTLTDLALLPGDVLQGPSAGNQFDPDIAAGANGYLAVWSDNRPSLAFLPTNGDGAIFEPGLGTMWDIYAMRLDPDGNAMDAAPIIVCQSDLNQTSPKVAWNGENWLVVWEHDEGIACCHESDIRAARVSPDGVVLDTTPIIVDLAQTMDGLLWPSVGSNGSDWAVVWRDLDSAKGIFTLDGARISAGGVLQDPGGKRLREDTFNSYPTFSSIAWAGDEYLLTWEEDSGEIKAQRLSSTLDKVGSLLWLNTYAWTAGFHPSVATNGTDFLVAWRDERAYGYNQLMSTRVAHDGTIVDPAGMPITRTAGYSTLDPQVVWDGTNWVIAYSRDVDYSFDEGVYVTRVTPLGQVLDRDGIVIQAAPGIMEMYVAATSMPGTGSVRMVWWESGGSTWAFAEDVYGAAVLSDGSVTGRASVANGSPRHTDADLTWNGSQYLAVFRSESSNSARILAQRFDASGAALDAEPIEVASGDLSLGGLDAAWGGGCYYIVWGDAAIAQIYGQRLGADGTLLDGGASPLMRGYAPAVGALRDSFLVAATWDSNPEYSEVWTLRVRAADGAVLDSLPTMAGFSFALNPNIVALGNRWLLVYRQNPSHDDGRGDIIANFINLANVAGTPFSVTNTSITWEEDPTVAVGRDSALILWNDDRSGTTNVNVYGRVLLPNGTFTGGSVALVNAVNNQYAASAAWDGSQYLVAFTDDRNTPINDHAIGDMFGVQVTGAGVPVDPAGFPISDNPVSMETGAALAAGDGQAAFGFLSFRPEAPYSNYRLAIRRIESVTAVRGDETARPSVQMLRRAGDVTFRYTLAAASPARLDILDATGALVRTLVDARVDGGEHATTWDGRDHAGRTVSAGVYLYRFVAGDVRAGGKVLLLR